MNASVNVLPSKSAAFQGYLSRLDEADQTRAKGFAELLDEVTKGGQLTSNDLLTRVGPEIAKLRETGFDPAEALTVLVGESHAQVRDAKLYGALASKFSFDLGDRGPKKFDPSNARALESFRKQHAPELTEAVLSERGIDVAVARGANNQAVLDAAVLLAAKSGCDVQGGSGRWRFIATHIVARHPDDAQDTPTLGESRESAPGRLKVAVRTPVRDMVEVSRDVAQLSLTTGCRVDAVRAPWTLTARDGVLLVVSGKR